MSFTLKSKGLRSAVCNVPDYRFASDCKSRGHKFDPSQVPFFRGDELISTVILLLSIDSFKKNYFQLQAKVCARITD